MHGSLSPKVILQAKCSPPEPETRTLQKDTSGIHGFQNEGVTAKLLIVSSLSFIKGWLKGWQILTDNGIHSFCPIHFSEAWPGLLFFFSPLLPLISMLDSGRPGWHCPPVLEMPPTMCRLSALASPAGLPVLGDVACGAAILAVPTCTQP